MDKVVSSYYELDSNMSASGGEGSGECLRQNSLLYLLLMLGTVWLSLSLYNFTKTYDYIFAFCEEFSDVTIPPDFAVFSILTITALVSSFKYILLKRIFFENLQNIHSSPRAEDVSLTFNAPSNC